MRRIQLMVPLLVCIASLAACGTQTAAPDEARGAQPFPRPARVAVMVLENRSYEQVIGSARAPYINRLARRNALATSYYAVAHPSLPNYIALTGGSMFGITGDCSVCDVAGRNIVQQLDTTGRSWKAYFEDLGSRRRPGPVTKRYNPHYNPFVYYEAVRGVDSNRDRVVGFQALRRDLRGGTVPDFAWIAPGVRHDGHNSSLHAADRYASHLVPQVLKALGPSGVLYLTWDEGTRHDVRGLKGPGGGRIALIAAGGAARAHARTAVPANHYALLRTLERGFGLPPLRNAGRRSTPVLRGLLEPRSQGAAAGALPE
jgi:hypothetical protein